MPTGREGYAEILRLALPALGALVAQPLFLLVDAAVVGTLGTEQLAGLGAASTVFATLVGLCIFLAYATTSSVARRVGAGDWRAAVAEGVEGMALGAGLGLLLAVVLWPLAAPLCRALGTSDAVTPYAVTYLHVVGCALPMVLAATAGIGVLRGLQDTRTTLVVTGSAVALNTVLCVVLVLVVGMGVAGSALATAVAETVAALAYAVVVARVARRHGVPVRPSGIGMLGAARTGLPLFWRTLALRGVFVLAAAVAARLGDADLAAFHVSLQVWMLLALAADSLAIAAQALLGRYLGASDVPGARAVTGRMVRLGALTGVVLGLLVLACVPWLPDLFSHDGAVRALIAGSLLVVALQQPMAGPVFVLDGVLIGAGDGRWLAWAGTAMLLAFVPAALLVLHLDAGVVGLWWALTWFMAVRWALLGWRSRQSTWLVTGAGALAGSRA